MYHRSGTFTPCPSYPTAMKTSYTVTLAGLALLSGLTAKAQDADHSWSKTYTVSGKPNLSLETSDASLTVRSCGDCREIRIHVEAVGRKLTDYRLEERQSGDEVHFLLKSLPHLGPHRGWNHEETSVTVEAPTQLTLQAKTADGRCGVSGLEGNLALTTADGGVTLDHVAGALRIRSADGRVTVTNANGSIDAQASDGSLNIDGSFHAVALHTSDGNVDLSLREGTRLTEPSTIRSSDGTVRVRVPAGFAADLDVHTSDGRVHSDLPITITNGDSNKLNGKLNGGGTPLTISTSDGSVKIEQL
jgi:VCBS repeat-containing protein